MTPDEILRVGDLNLAEAMREIARWHTDHDIRECGDVLHVAGPDSFPIGMGNAVMPVGLAAPSEPAAVLEAAAETFHARGRGFTLWIRGHLDAALEAHAEAVGLPAISDIPGMVLESPVAESPLPDGVRTAVIEDAATAGHLGGVISRAYTSLGLPVESCKRGFEMPERILQPQVIAVLGWLDDAPAAATFAILSHGVAGLYWVATVPEARQRGLGEACARLAGNAAFERGARCVVLQASQQGEPIYRRMGYREVTRYRWRVSGPPA